MASDSYRSDPERAAELACILALCAVKHGATVKPHIVATLVGEMQKAARSAKRQAEHECDYQATDAQAMRAATRRHRAQSRINAALCAIMGADDVDTVPAIKLGGDPRGPCATLHIPGQRGDGWGDGFAVY